jgi:hypothetical protein
MTTTNNTCKKCGCQDSFMVSPAPCPTPIGCPTPQPCSEIFDAQCVRYTGLPLSCTVAQTFNAAPEPNPAPAGPIVNTNDTVAEALESIVDYFCNNSGGSGIQIPQLTIQSQAGKLLHASILPGTESNAYLDYNPKIYLFVKKNGKNRKVRDINDDSQKKYYHGGWKHTTHMQGINFPNGNFYSGTTLCPTHSEFPLTITEPYERQLLTDFNPGEFYICSLISDSLPAPFNNTVLWDQLAKYYVRGRKRDSPNRSVYFRFAIGIENPDPNSKYPIIFGPLTASIQCKIVKFRLTIGGPSYVSYAINHDPTNIKHFNH